MDHTIAILAGGQSRRMGRDKAQLTLPDGGDTLLVRTARLAQAIYPSVLVVGRAQPPDWPLPGVEFVEDERAGQGPLGGLATALKRAHGHTVLLIACDLPRLTAEALGWLRSEVEWLDDGDGLITVNGEQREPLFSAYTPASLPLVERRLAEGRRSLLGLIEESDFTFAAAPPFVAEVLTDVDTPEDWAALVQ